MIDCQHYPYVPKWNILKNAEIGVQDDAVFESCELMPEMVIKEILITVQSGVRELSKEKDKLRIEEKINSLKELEEDLNNFKK